MKPFNKIQLKRKVVKGKIKYVIIISVIVLAIIIATIVVPKPENFAEILLDF